MSAATARHAKEKKEMVTIHNMCGHPLTFRIPGKDIRIGPRASMEIEKSALTASALQKLFRDHHIRLVEDETPPLSAGTDAPATKRPAGTARGLRRRTRPRTHK